MSKALTEPTEILLHQFAYGCYQNGLFEKSIKVFRLLTIFRQNDARYWYGLGSALMASGNYNGAINPLKMASIYTETDVRPRLYLAECLAKEGQKEEAAKILLEAEPLLTKEENCSLQEQFQMIKERVTKRETPLCQQKR